MLHASQASPKRFISLLRHVSPSHSSPSHINTLDHLLQTCSTIHQIKQIHAQIIQTQTTNSAFLTARLISLYSHFTHLHHAHTVFLHTPINSKTNVLLWNSILRAHISNNSPQKVLQLYAEMLHFGVEPDGFTFPLCVKACSSLRICRVVHSHTVVSGFESHLHVGNELVGIYGKLGDVGFSQKVFDKMPQRTHVSWNTMVSVFSRNCDWESAVGVVKRMELEGLEPNSVTWTALLSAHGRCGEYDRVLDLFCEMRRKGVWVTAEAVSVVVSVCADMEALFTGKEIHGYVVTAGFDDYVFVSNSLVSMYGKNKSIQDAKCVFSEMKVKNIVSWNALISAFAEADLLDEALEIFLQLERSEAVMTKPNLISWTTVVGAFASKERGVECLELFRRMLCAKVVPNVVTLASVLSTCAELGTLNLGREVHAHAVRGVIDRNILVENGLVHMYTRCGSLRTGQIVFDRIKCKDLISWNSMIVGYGMHGFGEHALKSFNEMLKSGFKPDGVTFVGVISACSHAGLVTEGRQLFDQMVAEYLITPQMEHYACMVDLLGRAGLLQEASDIVKMMPYEPNVCVWGALLNSCKMYRNTEVAEQTVSHIFNLKSDSAGSYMLLSNLYAAKENWEDSARVRTLAKTKGLKKTPGQSWIEMKKKVYMFSAGNTSQLHLEEVLEILHDLCSKMEKEGYIPDRSFALQDVGEEEKKQMLYGHSEKLTIAFGHVNIPPGLPIRVMKNLRVCGDCHNWTKFFSKMTNRVVIVRDGRRFHHFMDGACSCKDYW